MFLRDFTVENLRHIRDFHCLTEKQNLSNIQYILLNVSTDQAKKKKNYLIWMILNFLLRRAQVSSQDPDVGISCCDLKNKICAIKVHNQTKTGWQAHEVWRVFSVAYLLHNVLVLFQYSTKLLSQLTIWLFFIPNLKKRSNTNNNKLVPSPHKLTPIP